MKVEGGLELTTRAGVSGAVGAGEGSGVAPSGAEPDGGGPGFTAVLERTLDGVNRLEKAAEAKATALARGATDDLHGTMITSKEADIAMKLTGTVRNRLLDAFHELWRINL